MAFNVFLFFFGLAVGSFLNVVVDRLVKETSLLGRSRCDHCGGNLRPSDLIPVLSFFLLKRRSRCCGEKLSWYYPTVEVLTGLTFVFTWRFLPNQGLMGEPTLFNKWLFLAILACLMVIFFTDLKYQIIPDEILIILAVLSLPLALLNLKQHLLGALILSGFFYLIHRVTSGKAMGFGDVKFALVIGWLQGLKVGFFSVYFGFILGGIVGMILVALALATGKAKIAFGPFLVLGVILTIFFEKQIFQFWQTHFYPLRW